MILLVAISQGTEASVALDDSLSFNEVFQRARDLMTNNVDRVLIESAQIHAQLQRHGGHLLVGGPRPDPRSWGQTWVSAYEHKGILITATWDKQAQNFWCRVVFGEDILTEHRCIFAHEAEKVLLEFREAAKMTTHTCSPLKTAEAASKACPACRAQDNVACTCPDYWFPPDRREQLRKAPHNLGGVLQHHASCAKVEADRRMS